jgi:hypothetical protein
MVKGPASDAGRAAGLAKAAGHAGARTPEELEMLLEDALLMGDGQLLSTLVEEGALLVAGARPARGAVEIEQAAQATWHDDCPYLADPRQILQARDLVLIVTDQSLNVARRGRDGAWRYVILYQLVTKHAERSDDVSQC